MSGFNQYTTSGFTPPKNPPALLSWQQRRPVSGAHKKSLSSPSNSPIPPPLASTPAAELNVPSSSFPSPSPNKSHRQSMPPLLPATPPTVTPRAGRGGFTPKGSPGTFAPNFIKSTEERRNSTASLGVGIAGENSDFSGRRWVWVRDPEKAFVKGEVISDEDGTLTVRCDDGMVRIQ